MKPEIIESQDFLGPKLASIDKEKCSKCGICRKNCRFAAITEDISIDPISCEGCGFCEISCPTNAITMIDRKAGASYVSKIKNGYMIHALLNPGESNSGKLVTLVRQKARITAKKENIDTVIIDGAPGIGCPVIASISGVDFGLVITEPTLSGIHDMDRVLKLLNYFNVLPFVCVNMFDVNLENTEKIMNFCSTQKIEVVGKIPFGPEVTMSMVQGIPVVECSPRSLTSIEIKNMWKKITENISNM